MYFPDQAQLARVANRPIADRIARRYALLNGAYALLQVVVSVTTAAAYRGPLTALLLTANSQSNPPTDFFIPLCLGIGSCSLAGVIGLIASFYAARDTARATGDIGLGQRAGVLASLYGSVIWLVLGVIAALFAGTDGAFLVTDSYNAWANPQQAAIIAIIVAGRDLVLGGLMLVFALIFASLGAQNGASRRG